ncbi:IS3 family transposase [Peribacillus simplex]
MEDYNTNRYQWSLNRMTPAQYRSQLLAASFIEVLFSLWDTSLCP